MMQLIWKSISSVPKTRFLKKNVECEIASQNVLLAVDDDHYWWDRFSLDHAGVEHSPDVSWVVGNRDLTQKEVE